MKKNIQFRAILLLSMVLFANFKTFAQTTVTLPTACNTCPSSSSPCTAPTALVCSAATSISVGGTATSTVTGGTGGTITWAITPTNGVSTASGSGATTGAISFSTAGSYTVTFTSTNSTSPGSCSPAASVTCTRTITVNAAAAGSVTAFDCAAAAPSPAYFKPDGTAYTGTVTLSYTGGNGGTYAAGTVASTGVTGFTATWSAGILASGSGSITVNITGSSTVAGVALFPVTIAGQSCTITLNGCGAPTSAGGWLSFMCHNLGADYTADPFTPSWKLNGAYIQWGRRGPTTDWKTAPSSGALWFAAAPTGPSLAESNQDAIPDWLVNAGNPNTTTTDWNVDLNAPAKTANDPCPKGYRIPTKNDFTSIADRSNQLGPNNVMVNWAPVTGATWSGFTPADAGATNYSAGYMVNNTLYFPAAGEREPNSSLGSGHLHYRGTEGVYWSSTVEPSSSTIVWHLSLNDPAYGSSAVSVGMRNLCMLCGFSVRCVAE